MANMPQGVLARLRAAYKRLGEASEEDLKAIANAKDGAIPHELIYVVDGPLEIGEEHANPQMLFMMEGIRMGGDLTKLEKKLVAEAKKRLSARKSGGKRKTRRVGKKGRAKKNRKSRRTRRR